MPTKHPRIAITRDPEVERALEAAATALGSSKPDATLARELLLRGAKAVIREARPDIDPELDRYLDERGDVIRATMSRQERNALIREVLSRPAPPGPPMSEILDELREDRI
ncbi:MAG: hypothetical protein V7607_3448 [Solirubrobacteraceae bacterium]